MIAEKKELNFDDVPDAIIISDDATNVMYANKAAGELLKTQRDSLVRSRMFERVHPEDRTKVKQYAERLKREKRLVTRRRLMTDTGEYIIFERNTRLLPDGTQLSVCRRIPAGEREGSDGDAEKRFASMAGHELRNPLAGIRLYLDLIEIELEREGHSEAVSSLVRNAHLQVELQRRILDGLLDFSRLQAGSFALSRSRFELRAFLDSLLFQMRATTSREFTLTILPSAPVALVADQDRLYQVFVNLLGNAAKFSQAPHPIEMTVWGEDGACAVAIRDYGAGIEPAELERLFECFYRVEGVSPSGLGLGLYLADQIVRMHGGMLEVESAGKGTGSTFRVRLPLGEGKR